MVVIMMLKSTFTSESSKDRIEVGYFKKSHKSNLDILMFDDVNKHLELVNDAMTYLKNNGIQWICVPLRSEPVIPENTLFFKHEKFNRICCHIEGFETFYVMNLVTLIDMNKVHVDSPEQKGGWVVVQDKKKPLKTKVANIKKEIAELVSKMNA